MYKTVAIITAAGSGQRMAHAENKLFLKLDGISIIQRTINTFLQIKEIKKLYLVVQENELEQMADHLKKLSRHDISRIRFVIGGQTRQNSVLNGLEKISADFSKENFPLENLICLIHDGARPLIEKQIILNCINEIASRKCGVGVGVPVSDTIHEIDDNSKIINTPDRSKLVAIQTPQGAFFHQLLYAHRFAQKSNYKTTDDISVLRFAKIPTKIYFSNEKNIKITYPQDILLAERILETSKK